MATQLLAKLVSEIEMRKTILVSAILFCATLTGTFSSCIILVCENDWVSYSATGGCYKFFDLLLTWEDARAYCQENVPYNVGDLATIPDAGTNDFLQNLIQDANIWIGAFLNTTWTWSDGTPFEYINWHENEPNNGGGIQTHVAFNVDSSGQWDDEYKGNEKTFICHYKGKNKIH